MHVFYTYFYHLQGVFSIKCWGFSGKCLYLSALFMACFTWVNAQQLDWRNIENGRVIPDKSYSDQPYIVKTDDGAWLCVMTTGSGHEGASGQHIISQRSFDEGLSWQDMIEIEPSDGPEASYAVLLKAPSGRIFVFYNHNTDNLREVKGDDPPYKNGIVKRVDSQGYYVFKYSDDHGQSWSEERHTIPVRQFEIDKNNPYKGEIRFFWNVGKPFSHEGSAFVPLTKVGGFGNGFFTSNEGVLLKSDNLLDVADPADANWITLPDGDIGLQTPENGGSIAAEHSYSILSDGSFFAVYRSLDGHPVYSYSRDKGRTWDKPQYMRFADGRLMKNPRAANFAWKCDNGKYLYWFHNHGGKFIREHPNPAAIGYNDRNPVWMVGGVEVDSDDGKVIQWSQPDVLLYDEDPLVRMSYPDLIEENGNYYITETQKDIARVHQIDNAFLERLWGQFEEPVRVRDGLLLNWSGQNESLPQKLPAPAVPTFWVRDSNTADYRGKSSNAGFTIELGFLLNEIKEGQILADTRDASGKGWWISISDKNNIIFQMNDGQTQVAWSADPGTIHENTQHQVSIIIDGGPNIISFVTDERFNDGGAHRQFGWGRFSPYFKSPEGSKTLLLGSRIKGELNYIRFFDRALMVSEVLASQRWEK
ncbi:exo-alpha-sialidase [Cyclobacterium marinum]|uniref:exo-alpha-sialidase n=1 Tax=Cyclobacterium marinum TaxID=104 RepID=UPI0030D96040|tara:strand:- start:3242 stop:5176 length:1935 start_codon:yes stop_codon:yes gene_type:complete